MGSKAPKAPPIPDPSIAARAQGEANVEAIRESAKLSNIRQETPYGKVEYFGQLGTPMYTQRTTMSPEIQKQFDLQQALGVRMGNMALQRAGQINTRPIDEQLQGLPQQVSGLDTRRMPGIPAGLNQRALPEISGRLNVRDAPGMVTALDEGLLPRGRSEIGGPGVTYEGEWENLTNIPGADDFGAERSRVEGAVFDSMMSRLEPQMQQQRAAVEQSLANRGIPAGSEAWNTEMDNLNRAETDARQQALSQAIQLGGTEQGRLFAQGLQARGQQFGEGTTKGQFYNLAQQQGFGQESERARLANALRQQLAGEQFAEAGLTGAARQQYLQEALAGQGYTAGVRGQLAGEQVTGADMAARARGQLTQEQLSSAALQNQARQQALQEVLLKRTQPMNELAAIMQGGPAVQQPQFQPTAQYGVQPVNVMGAQAAQQQALQNQYAQQMAQYNQGQSNLWGTVGNLGGAAATMYAFSDRRLKTEIKPLGKLKSGLRVYSYRYVWGGPTQIGCMADEVQKEFPEALFEVAGFLAVDYWRIL